VTDEQADRPRGRARRGWALLGWVLLLLLALLSVFGAVSDLVADLGGRIPADHAGTYAALAGHTFSEASKLAPGAADYALLLERGYALHELTFALLFIAILLVPFRRRRRWAWWAAWTPMISDFGYLFTFGVHDPAILARSLAAVIALPVLLLAHIPAFYGRGSDRRPGRGA
jgi:hypothetical protein